MSSRKEGTQAMSDRDLFWIADRNLQVTSLSARLRELAGVAACPALTVHELWKQDDGLGIAVVAHQWALEGEAMEFETARGEGRYLLSLQPVVAPNGEIAGVLGRAVTVQPAESAWQLEHLDEVERVCGFGSWRCDLRSGSTVFSGGLARLLGVGDPYELRDVRAFDHPDDAEGIRDTIRAGEIAGTGYRCDHRILRGDGTVSYVQEQAHITYDDAGVARYLLGSMLDITERKLAEARLAQMAHYDPVSRLPNRALLEQRLGVALARARRNETTCGVVFLDIDGFKRVNDTYGHAAGDELLAAVGDRLTRHVRVNDTVARISGDEFVVVLDQLESHDDAVDAARKILRCFEAPFSIAGCECRISASIGISTYPHTASTPCELLNSADEQMYVVKRNGGRGIKAVTQQEEPAQICAENSAWPNSSKDRRVLPLRANVSPSF